MRRLRKGATELHVLRDLMLGGRHSRQTAVRFGISYPTADRWLEALLAVPGVRKFKLGKTTWYEWEPTKAMVLEAKRNDPCRELRTGEPDDSPPTVVLGDLIPELQRMFEAYLEAEPDGDRSTFASWVADEIPGLTHSIECECDCHSNNAVWPGAHCKNCGGTCEPGEG